MNANYVVFPSFIFSIPCETKEVCSVAAPLQRSSFQQSLENCYYIVNLNLKPILLGCYVMNQNKTKDKCEVVRKLCTVFFQIKF